MDVRSLKFFLAVAREGSFVKAAESLRLTQPNLSRTIRELEDEVGSALFVRSSRGVTLTDSGIVLRKRASEVMELIEKTRSEVASFAASGITGEVRLAAGEAENLRPLIRVMRAVQASHPGISYRIFSGNGEEVTRRIDNGLADFGVVFEPVDITRYDHLKLPGGTAWGVVMPVTAPWAGELAVTPEMLLAMPLLVPEQMLEGNGLSGWLGDREEKLRVVAVYTLAFTPRQMVEEGMGVMVTFEHLVAQPGLVFRPLDPPLEAGMYLIWKKHQVFSRAAECLLGAVTGQAA